MSTTISLKILTTNPNGLILYSGPFASQSYEEGSYFSGVGRGQKYPLTSENYYNNYGRSTLSFWKSVESFTPPKVSALVRNSPNWNTAATPLFALYLLNGNLHLIGESNSGNSVHLTYNSSDSLSDGNWHTFHIEINRKVSICNLLLLMSKRGELQKIYLSQHLIACR